MRRRNFIKAIAGSAVPWPLATHAQQADRLRRIGVLMNKTVNDREAGIQVAAFKRGLQELRWVDGRNVGIEYRWSSGDADLYRKFSAELVALAPDVILAVGGTSVGALQKATRTVPIVFVEVTDPVNRGLVASLARPGGNTTGFVQFEFAISGKWLELLKQFAPQVTRVSVLRDATQFSGVGQMAAIQAVAPSLRVELSPVDVRDAGEIERAITAFARGTNGGLIVTTSAKSTFHRDLIITLAARHRLPAVYPYRYYVTGGGLISYGPDLVDQYHRAADYVDRVLKGAKPADLPVQAPTKYELALNLKTAKALGLTVPDKLLATADAVIE